MTKNEKLAFFEKLANEPNVKKVWYDDTLLEEKEDSIWYDDTILEVEFSFENKDYLFRITAYGEIALEDKNDNFIRSKGYNSNLIREFLNNLNIFNDKDYFKALDEEKIIIVDNNWLEVEIIDLEEEDLIGIDNVAENIFSYDFEEIKRLTQYYIEEYNREVDFEVELALPKHLELLKEAPELDSFLKIPNKKINYFDMKTEKVCVKEMLFDYVYVMFEEFDLIEMISKIDNMNNYQENIIDTTEDLTFGLKGMISELYAKYLLEKYGYEAFEELFLENSTFKVKALDIIYDDKDLNNNKEYKTFYLNIFADDLMQKELSEAVCDKISNATGYLVKGFKLELESIE